MTTQTILCALHGNVSRRFSATATDATTTEVVSETGTLSLYKVMKGAVITHAAGNFAAGIGICRIRNTVTNQVKAHIILDVIGEEVYRRLDAPVKIEDNDVLEAYCDIA